MYLQPFVPHLWHRGEHISGSSEPSWDPHKSVLKDGQGRNATQCSGAGAGKYGVKTSLNSWLHLLFIIGLNTYPVSVMTDTGEGFKKTFLKFWVIVAERQLYRPCFVYAGGVPSHSNNRIWKEEYEKSPIKGKIMDTVTMHLLVHVNLDDVNPT